MHKKVRKKIRKPWMPADVTPEFLEDLRLKDFLGKLSGEEIVFAKELGVYRWDDYIKKQDNLKDRGANA